VTATLADLRTLTQIRWEIRRATAGMNAAQVHNALAAARWGALCLRGARNSAAYIDASVEADELALIADERAGRRAAA
jgi:hypothetical protein